MIPRYLRAVAAAPLVFAASTARAQAAREVHAAAFLEGCWSFTAGSMVVEERWAPAQGALMLGSSQATQSGKVAESETVRLQQADGQLHYRVVMNSQPEVTFSSAVPQARDVTFENLQHDFPKRIGYRLIARDSLEAWIDGGEGSKKIRYPYHRVACAK